MYGTPTASCVVHDHTQYKLQLTANEVAVSDCYGAYYGGV